MKKSCMFIAVLASSVAIVCTGWAQKPAANTDKQSVESPSRSLIGTFSRDGKTFTNEADHTTWDIRNPDKSKGYEGNRVLVKATVNSDKREIYLIDVRPKPRGGGPGVGSPPPPPPPPPKN